LISNRTGEALRVGENPERATYGSSVIDRDPHGSAARHDLINIAEA
jgi:hypothetical protein